MNSHDFLDVKQVSKTRTKSIALDNRNLLLRYGLTDYDFEYEGEIQLKGKNELQQIHNEVIHEVDEGGHEASVLNSGEPIKELHVPTFRKQFEESKEFTIRGMHEIKPIAQKKINKKCTDLDKFTEEILGPEKGDATTRNPPTPANGNIPQNNRPHISLADFDNILNSKEISPKNKMLDDEIGPQVIGAPFTTMASFQPKKNSESKHKEEKSSTEDLIKKSSTIVKDDSSIGFPTSNSTKVSSDVTKVKEPSKFSIKRSRTVVPTNPKEVKKEEVITKFGKTENPPLRKLPSQLKEGEQKKEDTDSPKIYVEEKFVLKIADIATESAEDVQPLKIRKNIINLQSCNDVINLLPPYKVKLKYIPTEWPLDLFQIDEENTKVENKEIGKEVSAQNSVLSGTMKSEIGPQKKRRRGTKINPEKKKKKADTESKNLNKKEATKKSEVPMITFSQAPSESAISNTKTKKEKEEPKENNNEKQKISILEEHKKIKDEICAGVKPEVQWSGQQVQIDLDPNYAVWLTKNLNSIRTWHHGIKGEIDCLRHMVKKFIGSAITDNIMNFIIIVNTVSLALVRYNQPVSEVYALDQLNLAFTVIFTVELLLKLFAFRIVGYLSDTMNCLDVIVVIFSWVEFGFLSSANTTSSIKILTTFKLLRTVRLLRLARVLIAFRSVQSLINVMQNTIGSFGFIGLLLLVIMCIYALFGMQLFGGNWDFPDGLPRPNFDSFNNAFISVFQLLTVENWPTLLYAGLRNQFALTVSIYFITFLFIGNYILLNLFMAIMLDAFAEVEEEMEEMGLEDSESSFNESRSIISSISAGSSKMSSIVGSAVPSKTSAGTKCKFNYYKFFSFNKIQQK